jgi:hypothetical protein
MQKTITFFFILFTFYACAQSENWTLIGSPAYGEKFVICIVQDDLVETVKKDLMRLNVENTSYYLINGSEYEMKQIADSLNAILASPAEIDKSQIFQVIVGDALFYQQKSLIDDEVFAASKFLYCEKEKYGLTGDYTETTWEKTISDFSGKHLFSLDINRIKDATRYHKYSKNGTKMREFRTSRNNPFFKNSVFSSVSDFMIYTFESRKRIKQNFEFTSSFSFGLKSPNAEDEIKSQVRSQINIGEIISGGGGEQEININTTIESFGYANLALQGRYVLRGHKFEPYAAVGLSYGVFGGGLVEIDTVIIIDTSEGLGGNGFDRNINRDEFSNQVSREIIGRVGIPISLGVHGKFKNSDRWAYDLHATYDFDANSFSANKKSMSNLKLGAGISFRILGKKETHYNYLRLRKKKILKP